MHTHYITQSLRLFTSESTQLELLTAGSLHTASNILTEKFSIQV